METHHLERQIAAGWPPQRWADVPVIVAVSGGADSVALLCALARLNAGSSLAVAHFNHRLRGSDSDEDEQFVAELCRRLEVPLHVAHGHVPTVQAEQGDGLEAAARHLRYAFFEETAARCGARYVATAHTADDQAETVLHHVLRGTGLSGLGGIPRTRRLNHAVTLVRPLLDIRRRDVLDYLASLNQPHRHDASNDDRLLTRNRLRHELLPLLAEQYNPRVVEALARLGRLAGEAQQAIDGQIDALRIRAVVPQSEPGATFDCAALADPPRYLVRELIKTVWREQQWPLQAMGFAEWDGLAAMAKYAPTPDTPRQRMFPGRITAERVDDRLVLWGPSSAECGVRNAE